MATYIDGMEGGKHNSDNTESTPKKSIYHITRSAPATQYWYYEVEAESEEQAMSVVKAGEVDAIDYQVDGYHQADDSVSYETTNIETI